MQDTLETLRHETLAHFGLNLLAHGDKADLLGDIIAAKRNKAIDEAGNINQVTATPSLMPCRLRASNLHSPETKRELAQMDAWQGELHMHLHNPPLRSPATNWELELKRPQVMQKV